MLAGTGKIILKASFHEINSAPLLKTYHITIRKCQYSILTRISEFLFAFCVSGDSEGFLELYPCCHCHHVHATLSAKSSGQSWKTFCKFTVCVYLLLSAESRINVKASVRSAALHHARKEKICLYLKSKSTLIVCKISSTIATPFSFRGGLWKSG